jgi:site-specific DNA-methyltransferase (adenine-specific)
MTIYNCDCISGAKEYLSDNSVDLLICDPPFGIHEKSFDKQHYNRDGSKIIAGYKEAPSDYYKFSFDWISQAKRIMKDSASLYVFSGWSKSHIIARVLDELDLTVINKIIWHFNFGVYTKKKFVTSHYEIFYVAKKPKQVTFNRTCRFNPEKKDIYGKSVLYKDMSSVWEINKEYHAGQKKCRNKLPSDIIRKIISYSSNEDDVVCDFFLGNFTTAIMAKKLGRIPCGFEINANSFEDHINNLNRTSIERDIL